MAVMTISLSDTGKRFSREWIFRKLSYSFHTGNFYAITGPNGSGKSTLLQVIAGATIPSEGSVIYSNEKIIYPDDQVYNFISLTAPYLDLIEEMTVTEFLHFHSRFKPFLSGIDSKKILQRMGLDKSANKQIRYFSSGMKQRVKLAQAIFSQTPFVLLDEPCTNLDAEGIALYLELIHEYCAGRLVIVSSNDHQEYPFCSEILNIMDWK